MLLFLSLLCAQTACLGTGAGTGRVMGVYLVYHIPWVRHCTCCGASQCCGEAMGCLILPVVAVGCYLGNVGCVERMCSKLLIIYDMCIMALQE